MSTAPVSITLGSDARTFVVQMRIITARLVHWAVCAGVYVDDPDGALRNAAITDARDRLAMALDAAEGIA